MEFKPNEVPDMVEGETRKVTLNLSGAVGPNTISEFTATSDHLTTSLTATNGPSASFFLTANKVGTHYVLVACELSSGETVRGYIRAKVTGEPCKGHKDDYE